MRISEGVSLTEDALILSLRKRLNTARDVLLSKDFIDLWNLDSEVPGLIISYCQ